VENFGYPFLNNIIMKYLLMTIIFLTVHNITQAKKILI